MRTFLLLCIILYSCAGESVPKGIFPLKKMEEVLYDIVRAEELVDFSMITDSTYRIPSKRYALYDSIFHIHKITKEDFSKSYQYYQGRPDLFKEILEILHAKTDTTIKTDSILKKRPGKELIKAQ
jgi:hypothetical protein